MEIDEEYYFNYKNECDEHKDFLGKKDKWSYINLCNLKVGDIVYLEYLPNSQRYLNYHTPECGKITEINEEKEIFILNHKNQIINIEKGHLGLYSKAYDIIILKLN